MYISIIHQTNVNRLLYDYFLFDVREKIKFSQTVLELGLDCYLQTIKLVNSYYKNLDKFFSDSSKYIQISLIRVFLINNL